VSDERPWAGRRLHLIGIGGAGMSGLARVAHALGAQVSGSDRADSATLARLRDEGVDAWAGSDPGRVPAGAEVVYSTAVPDDDPERAAARAAGARELHRADLLGEITALPGRRCIAVTGTHGKTTTTSMVVHALRGCGLDPGYLVGGEVRSTGANAGWGAGELVVVEADESDRSLLALHPDIAVLTNAELDHHATYASREELDDTFRTFLARATEAVVVWDRPQLRALAPGCRRADGAVGERADGAAGHPPDGAAGRPPDGAAGERPAAGESAREPGGNAVEVVAFDVPRPALDAAGSCFDWRGLTVRLAVPGAHNALNAAAALEACRLAGADPARAVAALADFAGAGRRFERLGETGSGAQVYDDYAHHPTEVAATIAAARTLQPGRVVAVFQPHLYSRTRALAGDFGSALAHADLVVVLDVYAARERQEDFPGVSGELVADATRAAATTAGRAGTVVAYEPDGFAAAEARLRAALRAGDLCLVMGAGDVDALGRNLVARAPARREPAAADGPRR
jgi:UDP-N-acetylmuramate--alanine ligase